MLTPLGVTVAEYTAALLAGNPCGISAAFPVYNSPTPGLSYSVDDRFIENNGLVLNDIMNGETNLAFGKAITKEVTIRFLNREYANYIRWTDEFDLRFVCKVNNVDSYIRVGKFTGLRPERTRHTDVVTLVAHDRMQRFDVDADPCLAKINFDYQIRVYEILEALCAYCNVQWRSGVDEIDDNKYNYVWVSSLMNKGYTCKDIVALIAEALGCYAKINTGGWLEFRWFKDADYTLGADYEFSVDTADIPKGSTWGEASAKKWSDIDNRITWADIGGYDIVYAIDGLTVQFTDTNTTIHYGTYNGNQYYIVDNPFLKLADEADADHYIKPIYERLRAFGGYLPASTDCVGNWLIESGDIITIDAYGENIKLPVFSRTIHWEGGCKDHYEATGEIKKQTLTQEDKDKLAFNQINSNINSISKQVAGTQEEITSIQQDIQGNIMSQIQDLMRRVSALEQQMA